MTSHNILIYLLKQRTAPCHRVCARSWPDMRLTSISVIADMGIPPEADPWLFQNRYKSIICQVEDPPLEERIIFKGIGSLYPPESIKGKNCLWIEKLEQRVLGFYQIGREELYSKSRQKVRSEARSVFCYWAVRELGVEGTHMAKRLKMSQPGVAYAISRGERIVKDNNFQMID